MQSKKSPFIIHLISVNLLFLICVLVDLDGSVSALSVPRTIENVTPLTDPLKKIPNQQGTLFGQDTAGNGIALGNWLDYGSWLVAITLAGQLYLVLWALIPVYYTLFAVTDPAELQRRSMGRSDSNNNTTHVTPASGSSWNLNRIVQILSLALETYQQLDMSELDCQKKLLCEVQQGKDFAASTARALSNVLLYFDFFKRIPNMEDYREAIKTGQRRISSRSSADPCSSSYAKCRFSMLEFNDKYRRLLTNTL